MKEPKITKAKTIPGYNNEGVYIQGEMDNGRTYTLALISGDFPRLAEEICEWMNKQEAAGGE